MQRRASNIRGLIVLNGALLLVLAAVTFSPLVNAQVRARGDYTMIGGNAAGTESSVLYLVDTINQDMVIVTYDQNAKQLKGVGYRNLAADAANFFRGGQQSR